MVDEREQRLLIWFEESHGYQSERVASVDAQNMGVGIETTWVSGIEEEPDTDLFDHDEEMGLYRIDNDAYDSISVKKR